MLRQQLESLSNSQKQMRQKHRNVEAEWLFWYCRYIDIEFPNYKERIFVVGGKGEGYQFCLDFPTSSGVILTLSCTSPLLTLSLRYYCPSPFYDDLHVYIFVSSKTLPFLSMLFHIITRKNSALQHNQELLLQCNIRKKTNSKQPFFHRLINRHSQLSVL